MKTKRWMLAVTGAVITAFGSSAQEPNMEKTTVEPSKILVAFYSWSGNTKFAAEQIRKTTGGTLFEIRPKKPYPSNYRACVDQAKKECREGWKPELAEMPKDLKQYEIVFIGSPNWWGTMAPPVRTFLSRADLAGKTVIPFFTHGGGGMQNCEDDVRKLCPSAKFLSAGAFSGSRIRSSAGDLSAFALERIRLKK